MLRVATLAQPDRTAVSCGTERLTFRQFRQRSTTMAGHLRRLGAAPDDPVGIFMEPSVDLMVSVRGVPHAGAPYLPLSPEYPDERLRYMIEDSRTRLIVTDEPPAGRFGVACPLARLSVSAGVGAESWTRSQS